MRLELERLTLFEALQDDPIIHAIELLSSDEFSDRDNAKNYYELIRLLLESGKGLNEYIVLKLIQSDHKKLIAFEKAGKALSAFEWSCLRNDLEILNALMNVDLVSICDKAKDAHKILMKIETDTHKNVVVEAFIQLFKANKDKGDLDNNVFECGFLNLIQKFGIGPFAIHPGFYVKETTDGIQFFPVEEIESLSWEHIYHYDFQKEALRKNTRALVEGKSFQHVLLVGASGTGKSTSVKSIVNLYKSEKLRLIQMQKGQLHVLPKVLESLKGRAFKFILFIDDLSFEANEDEYKFLKSFIEGSITNDAQHVAFYVTSNRRHLIKEIRSERENDIHLQDFIQEMTSLSDRFGLTLLYEGLNQNDYFSMIGEMAKEEGIVIEQKDLENRGRIYAMRHGKMSGRVATQFIRQLALDLEAEKK